MQLPLTSGCPCGALRYEVTEAPLTLYTCHCTKCQRMSSSAFQMSMPVRRTAFRVTAGTPRGWTYRTGAGSDSTSWFCPDCAGRIYGENTRRPAVVVVRAGSLDDTKWLAPIGHLWTHSAQPWQHFDDGTLCYATQPGDNADLLAAWRNRVARQD
ncbi:MAG TPA: GFA family protein [Acetobacteraceae bacterium]|jgi:hypothetical protein